MKLRIIVVTGATMLAACASSPSLRREVESGLRPPVVVASDDLTEFSLEGRRAEYQVPAMSIAIARNGRLSWMGAYGEGVDPTTVFQVASLSKAVSAVGVLKLAAEYGIDLDENIASRFTRVRAEEISNDVYQRTITSSVKGDPPIRPEAGATWSAARRSANW